MCWTSVDLESLVSKARPVFAHWAGRLQLWVVLGRTKRSPEGRWWLKPSPQSAPINRPPAIGVGAHDEQTPRWSGCLCMGS